MAKRSYVSRTKKDWSQSKKRKSKAISKSKANNSVISKGIRGPLNTKLRAQLNYSDYFNLDVAAGGATAEYVFSANGLFDPNITGAGHQPRGFDQLMALYDHYVVIGVKIYLTSINGDTGNGNIVGCYVADVSTPAGDVFYPLEARMMTYGVLGMENGQSSTTLELQLNPNKFLGRASPLSDPQLKGSSSANPSEQAYIHCFCIPGPGGVDTQVVYNHVRIEYDVVFIEPKTIAQS